MFSLSRIPRSAFAFAAGLLLACVLPAQSQQRDYSFSDATSDALPKFKEASEAKDYARAMTILEGILAKVPADSYDAAYVYQWISQIHIQKGDYLRAIEPIERSLQLSESKNPTYFDERQTREIYFFLVQLYFQEAVQTKNHTLALAYFDKADKAMQKWRKMTTEINADAQLIYCQLLVSRAMATTNPDKAMLQQAIKEIDAGLLMSTHPKDNFYLLKLVCLQQLDRTAESAELLELLVRQKPDNSGYWNQLFGTYINLAAAVPPSEPALAKTYYIRAIVTMERAQANGQMNTPKDHSNLISIYFNIGQYEKAAELLETGLQNGIIENDQKNWELLALCYQQLERPLKGIDALKRAAKIFPKSGQLEFLIAQAYNGLEKPEEALPHIQAAIAKGGLNKPYQAQLSLAFTAYSLKKYDVALAAAKKATEYPEGVRDGENMVRALEDIIKEREAKKNKS
jgi:tetratricopeptide (TPR) repeat protein